MIKVTVTWKQDKIISLSMEGHALSAEEGQDLVCAGASAIFEGGVYALEGKNIEEHHSKGKGLITVKGPLSLHDEYVLQTMKSQLEFIGKEASEYLKVTEVKKS